jgi:O-antigen/teichoic acid export membrane protein
MMQGNPLSLYVATASLGSIAKIVRMASVFFGIWLINQIIGKEEFGLAMIAVTFYYFLSAVVTSGFKSLTLYKVARMEKDDPGAVVFGGSILTLGFSVALLISLLSAFGANIIAVNIFGQPELTFWIFALAFYLPFDLCLQTLCFWHRARQDAHLSIVFLDLVPPLLRISVLAMVWLAGWDRAGVVSAYISEVIVSFMLLYFYKPLPIGFVRSVFTKEDRDYGLKMSLTQLFHQPARSIDILLVGALTSPAITAEYAVASRFLTFLVFGKQLVEPLITPRIGSLLQNKKLEELKNEYEVTRVFSFVSSLAMVLLFVLSGEKLLGLFGDYKQAYPLLLILSAAVLMRTGTGFNGAFLNMAGYAGYTLITIAIAAFIILVPGYVMISCFGAIGAAFAVLFADIVSNSLVTYLVWRLERFRCIRPMEGIALAAMVILLVLTGIGLVPPLLAALFVFAVLAVFTYVYYHHLEDLFRKLNEYIRPHRR